MNLSKNIPVLVALLLALAVPQSACAQTCSVSAAPSFARSCFIEYAESISATGSAGVTSTISVSNTSCTGVYFDNYTTQGIVAQLGSSVNINLTRNSTNYTSYVTVYVDWNNDGVYDTATERVGRDVQLFPYATTATYGFDIPNCVPAMSANLHMRLMMSEAINNAGTPCSANWGQAYDFYLRVDCPATPTVTASPSAVSICSSAGIPAVFTASGAPSGSVYTWSPSSGLSTTTGASVSAYPSVSTVYTVTVAQCSCTPATATVSVNVLSTPGAISGPATVCVGSYPTLTNAVAGGVWESLIPYMASIGSTTGVVYAMHPPTAVFKYSVGTSSACQNMFTMSIIDHTPPISGTPIVCMGGTTTLSNSYGAGTWSSFHTAVATVGSTGIVTGVTAGTAMISYTPAISGCGGVYIEVTVNQSPSSIAGALTVCYGAGVTLSSSPSGGTWTSSDISRATVGASTGVVNGVTAGTATISYTLANGCRSTANVAVVTAAFTGPLSMCSTLGATLVPVASGGTWSSSTTGVATINSSGVVSPVSAGTTTITYTRSGCTATAVVTIHASPAAISGPSTVCAFTTNTFTSATSGGTWSSSHPAIATIDPSTGVATGIERGTVTFTYTLPSGCYSVKSVLYDAPVPITGTNYMCDDSGTGFAVPTVIINAAVGGGSWSVSSPGIINLTPSPSSIFANITSVSSGTVIISYTLGGACYDTMLFTVYPKPTTISGPSSICSGYTGTYTNGTSGGTWLCSPGSVATVNSATGVVTGVSAGTANLTYYTGHTIMHSCFITTTITITGPSTILGPQDVCEGSTIGLSSTTSGGTWTSSNTSIATVGGSSGVVSGVAAGTVLISYHHGGCIVSTTVTVHAMPAAIAGPASVCNGATITLTNTVPSGVWSSSNGAVATINSSGVLSGVSPDSVMVSYTINGMCSVSRAITVYTTPGSIGGVVPVCEGTSATLTCSPTGGTWSISHTSVAYFSGAPGVITGVAAGTAAVTYTLAGGCYTTAVITVNTAPSVISGNTPGCVGSINALLNSVSGGVWSSTNYSIAVVASTTGVVNYMGSGTARISYTLPNGCATFAIVTVSLSTPIVGVSSLCSGTFTVMNNATPGGAWNSSNPTAASISSLGILDGLSGGTATISYVTGCVVTKTVTVFPNPTAITGANALCVGANITLASTPSGGEWSSSLTHRATVNASTGVVTGISAGTTTITYSFGSGACRVIKTITVDPFSSIAGLPSTCMGSHRILTHSTPAGTWSSSSPGVATVSVVGVVSPVSAGTTTISYQTGCLATVVFTVYPMPVAISGPSAICAGSTVTFSNSVPGGEWVSNTPTAATVGESTGDVTAIAAGFTTIFYRIGTSCTVSKFIAINAPDPILGTTSVCNGVATTLTVAIPGGTWSSSNTSVATVASTGTGATATVTSLSAGTTTISYTTGCYNNVVVTVHPVPAPITGASSVCVGATITLYDAVSGGTWSSSNTTLATVDPATGVVSGISAGNVYITYAFGGGLCRAVKIVYVRAMPSAISGTPSVCRTNTTTLSNTLAGGVWSSSNTGIVHIYATGVCLGIAAGTANITYSKDGCFVTAAFTVSGPPDITGASIVCTGSTITLSNSMPGGTWSSTDPSIATVSSSGVVTGISSGLASILYTVGACSSYFNVTVKQTPSAISGPSTLCTGATIALTNSVSVGVWISSNTGVASFSSSPGILHGVSAGSVVVTYTTGGSCLVTKAITVSPGVAISGARSICLGSSISLTGTPSGGTWVSSNTGVAIVSSFGSVSSMSSGYTDISYARSGCIDVRGMYVSPTPGLIYPTSVTICRGVSSLLSNAVPGGVWQSSNNAVATVSSGGLVAGISNGIAIISYTMFGTSCGVTRLVTVVGPSHITGITNVCVGKTTTLTNSVPAGTWSSSNTSIATVSSSGVVTGVSSGTVTIFYSISGCIVSTEFTVNDNPAIISGVSSLCEGSHITLSNPTVGGTWSSSIPSRASINILGVVLGLSPGATVVSYTLPTGCYSTKNITVNTAPSTILPATATVCKSSTLSLTNTVTGGAWVSSNPAVASVSSSGLVTGISYGSVAISYTLSTGCSVVKTITVPGVAPISGTAILCTSTNSLFTSAPSGGAWTSSNTSKATVSSVGLVTGVAAGIVNISYNKSGCIATYPVTVNTMPGTIVGLSNLCEGNTATQTNSVGGGTWSSSNTAVATISSVGGVTGIAGGTTTITYTTGAPCSVTKVVTVTPMPPPITGPTGICITDIGVTYTNSMPGGTWSSSDPSIATINSSGVITMYTTANTWVTFTYTIGSCIVSLPVYITGC